MGLNEGKNVDLTEKIVLFCGSYRVLLLVVLLRKMRNNVLYKGIYTILL